MLQTANLSESAVAVLRFILKGWKKGPREIDLPAYRELVAAGIMEPHGDAYRLTEEGGASGSEIVDREYERIERERYAPPDVSGLSGEAWELFRRVSSGERVEITPENRPLFRELASARILVLGHSFAGGPESAWRWTYWGWNRRPEWVEIACARRAV